MFSSLGQFHGFFTQPQIWSTTERQNHGIIELKGAYKAIERNSLLNAGIQIKANLTDGGLMFS